MRTTPTRRGTVAVIFSSSSRFQCQRSNFTSARAFSVQWRREGEIKRIIITSRRRGCLSPPSAQKTSVDRGTSDRGKNRRRGSRGKVGHRPSSGVFFAKPRRDSEQKMAVRRQWVVAVAAVVMVLPMQSASGMRRRPYFQRRRGSNTASCDNVGFRFLLIPGRKSRR